MGFVWGNGAVGQRRVVGGASLLTVLLLAALMLTLSGPAQAATETYQAEAAVLAGGAVLESTNGGFTGSGYVNFPASGGTLEWRNINGDTGGAVTLSFRFALGITTSRTGQLTVNGISQSITFNPTGAWTTWQTHNVAVTLSGGTSNTIRLSSTGQDLANIDQLTVTTAGTAPTGTRTSTVSGGTATRTRTSTVSGGTATRTPTSTTSTWLYVATSGNDSNPGTIAQPLRTIQRAVDLVQPGGTIAIRGGTYAPSTNIQILKNGTASQPITMRSYNGEHVIIDGENMPYTPGALDSSIPRPERGALHLEGDWWRFVQLEIIHGPYGIFGLDTNNNIFDRLVTRDNYESGLHLQGASSNNLILNLDSYGNYDPRKNGESADGLAIKEGSGTGNVVRGARLWNNSDDGFDAWKFLSPITIESSVAWGNGFNRWNLPGHTGDGNGFKMGGGDPDPPAAHVVRNSIAFNNATGGFVDNGNPGSMRWENNTAYRNARTSFDAADSTSTLLRNLSVGNGTAVSLGSSTGSGNSWNIKSTWGDSDLLSTSSSIITGPRNADGSIRTSDFLRPRDYATLGARI